MEQDANDRQMILEALAALRADVAALAERVAAIEKTASLQPPVAPISPANRPAGEITPEILAVISAAVAAYLGVKPRIRQISVVGGNTWAQQGRVTIQASHFLAIHQRE